MLEQEHTGKRPTSKSYYESQPNKIHNKLKQKETQKQRGQKIRNKNERINKVIGHFVPNGHHGVFEGGFVMMCPHERVVKRKGVLVRGERGRIDAERVSRCTTPFITYKAYSELVRTGGTGTIE